MSYTEQYDFWLEDSYFDEKTKEELKAIAGNEKEIEDRFYKELEFGTGGLRGVIGAGTNRMNMIPEECLPNLQMRRLFALQLMALRLMCLMPFVLHRSFLLHCVHFIVFPVL